MICLNCTFYRAPGLSNPLTPTCLWKPNPEELAVLRATLPAPALSRVLVQTAPYKVEQCATYKEVT